MLTNHYPKTRVGNTKKEKHSKLDVDAESILKICNSSSSSSLKIKKIKKMLGKKTRKVKEVPEIITMMGGEEQQQQQVATAK